jgi:enoyl-CoA hydratase/carnithine racemase
MKLNVVMYDVSDGVAVVTLNRPERLNAWSGRMELEYRWCMATADADPDVKVIVVTGAGRGFCSGVDFRALDKLSTTGEYDRGATDEELASVQPGAGVRLDFEHVHSFLMGLRKPVIAAVNGPAAGAGFVLMCFTDIRFAAAGAKLTSSFARLGLPAEHGLAWILPRIIGMGRAAELLFSARVMLAEEAAEIGLVNKVLPPDDVLPYTLAYARDIAQNLSPHSLLMMKRQLYTDMFRDLDVAAGEAEQLMEDQMAAHDFKEGVAAFQAKRPPMFDPLP